MFCFASCKQQLKNPLLGMQQCAEFIPQIPMVLQILFVLSDVVNTKGKK